MVAWHVLTETVRGASHHRNGLPNQDAVAYHQPLEGHVPLLAAIADGHGSKHCSHSHLGAKFAVEAALENVNSLFNTPNLTLPQIRMLAENVPKAISNCWRNKIDAYINNHLRIENSLQIKPGTKNRYLPFGTTLLVSCVLTECILYWQLGDGDIAIINRDNSLTLPMADDARLLGNDTTSLCSSKPWQDFRFTFMPLVDTSPKALFLVTDGYKNSFKLTEGFYQALADISEFIDTDGAASVQQALAGWLNETSQQGSGDDITLAVIYTRDK